MQLPIKDWAKEEGIADVEMVERLIEESDKKMAGKTANIGKTWKQLATNTQKLV